MRSRPGGGDFEEIIQRVGYQTDAGAENIEHLLSRCQLSHELSPDKLVGAFIARVEKLIVTRCDFVNGARGLDAHEVFLRKVARRSTRLPRMKLFTTNYDLCIEVAASRARFIVVDGFSHTSPQEFDGTHFGYDFVRRDIDREIPNYIPNVFQLLKVHGSIDWEEQRGRIVRTARPARPHIIYPGHSKFELSYDQPFLEMMSRFQAALRQPSTGALIIGFGFNDHHLNQPLLAAIRSNVSLKAVVIDPFLKNRTDNQPLAEMQALIHSGDLRLSLVECRFESFVQLLPDLVAATEDEQHKDRVLKATGQ